STIGLACYSVTQGKEGVIQAIYDFHKDAKLPIFEKTQAQKRFISKCGEFFLKDLRLYKKNGEKTPLLVVMDPAHKQSILLHAHEKLGHRGIYSVQTVVEARFHWPNMRRDIHHHVKSCHECQIRSLKRLEIPITI